MAPKATSSDAPSVRSTIATLRSPRTLANLDSLRRASFPVSQGTTVLASTRLTARINPAAGSIHHKSATVAEPTSTAIANGGMIRMARSCNESTSCTTRASRSPRRKAGRPVGASRSSR